MRLPHVLDCRLGADIARTCRQDRGPWNRGTFGPWGSWGAGSWARASSRSLARAGIEVVFLEPTEELVAAGRARIEASTGRAVERGKLTTDERDDCSRRVRGATDAAAFADVDLVIEAATEDPAVKLETFRTARRVVGDEVVLASNTSSIPIATLGAATGRPDRVIGMHFFNPPPVMGLVELTPSLSTSAETVAFARGFGERLGKTVVVAKDHAGFIVNRLVIPYLCAAIRLYDEGFATPRGHRRRDDPGHEPPDGPAARSRTSSGSTPCCRSPRCCTRSSATRGTRRRRGLQRMVDGRAPGQEERPRVLRLRLSLPPSVGMPWAVRACATGSTAWQPSAHDGRGERAACSSSSSLFSGLDPKTLAYLGERAVRRSFEKGRTIFYQGDLGDTLVRRLPTAW